MNSWKDLFQALGVALVKFHKGLDREIVGTRWWQFKLRAELYGAKHAAEAILMLVEGIYVQKTKDDINEHGSSRSSSPLN